MDNDKQSSSKPSHLSLIIESDANTIVMDESPKSDDEITDTSNFTETHYANLKSNAESFLDDDQEIHNVPEDGTFLNDVSINANSPAHDDDIQTNDTMENTDINGQKNKPLSKYFNETQILVKEEVDEIEGKDINNEINKRLTHVELKIADEKTKDSENMVSLITVDQHSDKRKDKVVTGVDHDSPNMDSNINMRPLTSSTIQDVPGGLRAKPNTPASQSLYVKQDTFKSGVSSPSTDRLAQNMSTVGSSRSSGAGYREGEELYSDLELRYGVQTPHYFLVHQTKPSPMPPLPVWRGYRGNVYFQPIYITKLNCGSQQYPASDLGSQRSSGRPYRLIESPNQVYVLDKQVAVSLVSNRHRLRDELKFIGGAAESTGSLAVRPDSAAPKRHVTSRASSSKSGLNINSNNNNNAKPKIRKGSNFHSNKPSQGLHGGRTHSAPLQSKQFYLGSPKSNRPATTSRSIPDPKLVVSGGKLSSRGYYYSCGSSPTATVLSFSTQRARVNTPDICTAFEKFPALERRLSSVDLEVHEEEEEHSFRNETQSRASNHSVENWATPRNYTPKVQVRRLVTK